MELDSRRWYNAPCEHCGGSGKTFFCDACDVDRPMDCVHEAGEPYTEDELEMLRELEEYRSNVGGN